VSAVRFDGFAGPVPPPAAGGRRRVDRPARPLYARVLRLRVIRPGSLLCFLYFEGMIALGALLALAELTSWWAVAALPAAVAAMVKLNDMLAGLSAAPAVPATRVIARRVPVARGRAAVPAVLAPAQVRRPGANRRRPNQRRFDRPVA
jgi:hypothetical protein